MLGTCKVTVLGDQSINGRRLSSTRTLEFILALSLGGGERRLSSLKRYLFAGVVSKSAVPTLAYRTRKLGIATEFVPSRASYRLIDCVAVDAIELLDALDAGDVRTALQLYGGPCLANSHSPLATEARQVIDRLLTDAVLAEGSEELVRRAADKLDSPRFGLLGSFGPRIQENNRPRTSIGSNNKAYDVAPVAKADGLQLSSFLITTRRGNKPLE